MEETLLEYFEWYLPSDCGHWRRVAENASRLAALGFTGMWLPPAYKGHQGREDVGYGVYDLYDLGEFDQKGSVDTKYGTWEEYLSAIYQFEGKEWDWEVDGELGNYDYLMGTGLDMGSPKVVEDLDRWGKWYLQTTGVNGFRLDAVKHVRTPYFLHWLQKLRKESGKALPAVGEYWHRETGVLTDYLDRCGQVMRLFDVPLHFQFHRLSSADGAMNLGELFRDTLTGVRPHQSVTFVDNHDTQPGQALQSWVAEWPSSRSAAALCRFGFRWMRYTVLSLSWRTKMLVNPSVFRLKPTQVFNNYCLTNKILP